MKVVEKSAKTVAEAIQIALEELSASREEVKVDVLEESKPGLLGLGGGDARVRVSLLKPEPGNEADVVDPAEVAQDVLEELLDKMGVDADVEIGLAELISGGQDDGGGLLLNIRGDDLGILIGRRGQTLSSLQYLVRLLLANRTQTFMPLVIDVNGYRQRRFEALRALAQRMAEQVTAQRMPFSLEAMPAFERRIIHLALAEHSEVTTQSVGIGEGRKVVIVPKETA
jgi:spoIIIJ-associated protein